MPPKKPRPDLASLLQLPKPRIAVDATRTPADLPRERRERAEVAARNLPTSAMRATPERGGSNRGSTTAQRIGDVAGRAVAPGDLSTVGGWLQEFVNPVRGAAVMAELGADAANSLVHGRYGNAALDAAFAAMGLVGVPGGSKAAKLPKKWAVLTPENPGGRALSAAENDALRARWTQTLRDRGIRFRETTGAYTDQVTGNALSERGFLLENVTAAEAEALGREMGQNAVLTHRGYHDLQNQVLFKSKGITPGTSSQYTEVGGARFSSDIDWSKPVPRANPEIEQMWRGMRQPDADNFPKVDAVDEAAAQRMAQVYESLPANDPQAAEAYRALTSEVDQQFKAIQDAGYTIEFTPNDPYAGENPSLAMMKDLRENRRLRIFATPADDFHPYLTPDQNNKFRAVHDFLAHAGGGNQFGPLGEENAYRIHAQTLSPTARRALATETRGQNSWVNFGPNRELPAAQRPFATQKAALWPEEFVGDYRGMPQLVENPEYTRIWNELMKLGDEGSDALNTVRDAKRTMNDAASGDAWKPEVAAAPRQRAGARDRMRSLLELRKPLQEQLARTPRYLDETPASPPSPSTNPSPIASTSAPAFEMTRPQNILTPPSSGNVFDESLAGHLRGLPTSFVYNRPPVRYPTRADLSVLEGMPRRVREHFERNVDHALRVSPESQGWYNVRQLRDAWGEFSPNAEQEFRDFAKFMGPTSVGNTVPLNIRQASLYSVLNRQGKLRGLLESGEPLILPVGYRNRRQKTVNAGLLTILRDGDLNPFTQPKTRRYTGNIAGDASGTPLDMHLGRVGGLPGLLADAEGNLTPGRGYPRPNYATTREISSSPVNTHYPVIEDMWTARARMRDMAPDQYMALGWVGGAQQTGVADTRTLIQLLNEKFRRTAARDGGTPLEALQRFLRGERPLY